LHSSLFVLVSTNSIMTAQAQPAEKENQTAISGQGSLERFDWLPCRLSLEIPVSQFTLGDLLRLQKDCVVSTTVPSINEVPLSVNGQPIAWIQFEMIGNRLAARITELA
jgi:flagellar motor switch/type III secretory pathway protein FliN